MAAIQHLVEPWLLWSCWLLYMEHVHAICSHFGQAAESSSLRLSRAAVHRGWKLTAVRPVVSHHHLVCTSAAAPSAAAT